MNEDLLRQQLEAALRPLDWSVGIPKSKLVEHLRGDPASQGVVDRGLAGGVYFSPADVLTALPATAWQPAPPVPPRQQDAAGPFAAGPFAAGPFAAGPFAAGPFAAGPFGRFGQHPDASGGADGQSGPAPGVPDPLAEKTAAAAAVGAGLLALAGVALWVGRRLSQK